MATTGKLRIASLSPELVPFSFVGGLAHVARSLPRALADLGHEVVCIVPLHDASSIEQHGLTVAVEELPVVLDGHTTRTVRVWHGQLSDPAVPVYLIDDPSLFSGKAKVYGSRTDNQRYALFGAAALALLEHLDWRPTVLQAHDWPAGLALWYAHQRGGFWQDVATVFTVHNLTFQMQGDWWGVPVEDRDRGYDSLPLWHEPSFAHVNFARRALRVADVINTVSETYAKELLSPNHGQGQEKLLQHRAQTRRLFGIVNGLDYDDFNPRLDPGLVATYDYDSLAGKTKNKLDLQATVGLPVDPKVPLVAMASRITEQKGFDLVLEVLEPLLRLDLQLIIWGGGDRRYETAIRRAMRRHPRRVKANLEFDTQHVTRIYAGADIFLMPSRFEPCGLGQLESLRYGAIPIVHATGGLADTITDYNARTSTGNGFVFHTYDHHDLLAAVARAVEAHRHRDDWLTLVRHAMRQSFNWLLPARKYVQLFRRAAALHHRLRKGSDEPVLG